MATGGFLRRGAVATSGSESSPSVTTRHRGGPKCQKLAAAKARRAKGESVTAVAKALGVSRATLYRALADAE
ncbi:helix-turn-helix domain-containing protein [Streptomyces sp. NPDC001282]|uniref:helix-turn-helix domain-containing protein n=1 Tax=Streptomyces sp. NPDC001282 TaxID=3364557 RepID=UPI00368ABE29